MAIAVLQANLNGLDSPCKHEIQSLQHDYHLFDDNTHPSRLNALKPRLQAKIPKMFGWELKKGYDIYLWLDGNISLNHSKTLQYFYDQIQGNDIVVLRHPRHPNIRQEVRYTRKGINQQSIYMVSRYQGEYLQELYDVIRKDKSYVDDLLVIGGVFMYRNTPEVQKMFKEWWYYVSRFCIQDQISFAYVLKKSGIKIKVLDHIYDQWDYLKVTKHKKRNV